MGRPLPVHRTATQIRCSGRQGWIWMRGDPHGAGDARSDTRTIKRSRQDDLALLGTLRADVRMPNRAKRIRALCYALDVPILPTDPAGPPRPPTIDGVAEQPP